MWLNYFKIGWRNLWYNKGYSAINIFGLGLGMAVALLIGLWVRYELSYDQFFPGHTKATEVMITVGASGNVHTQPVLSLAVKSELEKVTGVEHVAESNWPEPSSLIVGDKKISQFGMGVGADFLRILDYPMIAGSRELALKDPNSIVLTASNARSLFGDADPIGRMVKVDNQYNMKVTGVLADVPSNASVMFNYLVPFSFLEHTRGWMQGARTQWGFNSFRMWASLRPGASLEAVNDQIAHMYRLSGDVNMKDFITFLQPASRWHLFSEFKNGVNTGGFIDYVRMFSLIGFLVLLIACINFMNLATARSDKRAREVGVRKAVGSGRREIIFQFLIESFLLTAIAFLFGLSLVQMVLPWFNKLAECDVAIPFGNGWFWLCMGLYMAITGILAGSRPAFYLSAFRPVKVLKGTFKASEGSTTGRRALVVLQFASSVALIIASVIIYQQIRHAQGRPKGYDPVRLVSTDNTADLSKNYKALRADLIATGVVEDVALAGSGATWVDSHTMIGSWPGKVTADLLNSGIIGVDNDYFSTMGMSIKEGHNFNGLDPNADSAKIIVNEAAVGAMGLKDPVGKLIRYYVGSDHGPVMKEAAIIAVVKNAIMESPYAPVAPAMFQHWWGGSHVVYRLSDKVSPMEAIRRLTPVFEKYNPGFPYSYHFVDVDYASKFQLENLVGTLAAVFAGLTILISCLGLFALATYMAAQRTREIGIRKVLGATVWQLWVLLSKDFLVLVVGSCLLAVPVAWLLLQHWLEQFNYRIHLGAGVFLLASGGALVITICTISYQAIRAATTDPVKSLRTE